MIDKNRQMEMEIEEMKRKLKAIATDPFFTSPSQRKKAIDILSEFGNIAFSTLLDIAQDPFLPQSERDLALDKAKELIESAKRRNAFKS